MKKTFITLLAATSFMVTGCGSGFNSLIGGSDNNSSSGTDNGSVTPTPGAPTSWDKVEMDGVANGGPNDNTLVVYIDKVNQALILVLPIPMIIPTFGTTPVSQLDGAKLTSYKGKDGTYYFAVSVPLRKIVREGSFMPKQRLPNGDALPYVPAGELPGFGIAFPQMTNYQIHLYVGVNVAAAFVELPNDGLPFGWISPVKNKAKTKVVGAVGYVAPKGNYDGGMYLAAQLPADLARAIDNLIRW